MTQPARAKPGLRQRIGFLAAYLAFLLVTVEIALQVFYFITAGDFLFKRVGVPVFAPNEWSGVFNRPNLEFDHRTNEFQTVYYTNAQGFRTDASRAPVPIEKPPNTYRILLMGPSFAYGWGVDYEDTFGARLARELEERGFAHGRRIELINAGVPSLPAYHQLEWYRNEGHRYAPDMVVQMIYGSMAVPNRPRKPTHVDADGFLVEAEKNATQRFREQLKKSAIVFYGWVVLTKLRENPQGDDESGEVLGAGRKLTSTTRFSTDEVAVAEALEYYAGLQRATDEGRTRLLIIYFPLSFAVHPQDMARWRHLGVRDVEGQIAFDAAFCNHLSAGGVPCFNATDTLRETAREGERLYYWLDIHWTERGNEVTAISVADHLTASGH